MKNKGTKLLALAGMLLVGAAGVGSSMAYFTESDSKINVFTMSDLDIGLEEPEWDPDPEGDKPADGENMYPGYTVYKNPTVKNLTSDKNGDAPCYIRIKVEIQDHDGVQISSNAALDLIKKTIYFDKSYNGTFDKKGIVQGLTENRVPGYSLKELASYPTVNPLFELDEERSTSAVLVYNYMGSSGDGILDIGEEATLFTNIVIPTDWNQTHFDQIGDFQLDITAEAIQSSGFASQEEAYEALDSEISQGTLQKIER